MCVFYFIPFLSTLTFSYAFKSIIHYLFYLDLHYPKLSTLKNSQDCVYPPPRVYSQSNDRLSATSKLHVLHWLHFFASFDDAGRLSPFTWGKSGKPSATNQRRSCLKYVACFSSCNSENWNSPGVLPENPAVDLKLKILLASN